MPVITVDLDQEQIDRAQQIADRLSEMYGVKVSRAAVIRRAIMAYTPAATDEQEDDHEQPAGK